MALQHKLTKRQRAAATESLRGKQGVTAVVDAGYYDNEGVTYAGSKLIEKPKNPLTNRDNYIARTLQRLETSVIERYDNNQPVSTTDYLRAVDILLKSLQHEQRKGDSTGNTYNTMIVGDVKALDEAKLMQTLAQLRDKAAEDKKD